MSIARPIIPGAVLFSTRRTHKRQLLLRPSKEVNEAVIYIVAVLAERHAIRPHALCVMSNYKDDVSTDALGRSPEFDRDCHALIARVVNALHHDDESLWSREPTRRVTCLEAADVLEKIAGTMANPVEARMVAHGHSWPGIRLAWPTRPRTVRRPAFFRTQALGGTWPEEATLHLHRPPGYEHLSDDELAALLRDRIEQREQAARDAARAERRRFVGRRAVLAQARADYPKTTETRSTLRPSVTCKSRGLLVAYLCELAEWRRRYRDAFERYRNSEPFVLFPYGTWKMRVYYSACCDPIPIAAYRLVASAVAQDAARSGVQEPFVEVGAAVLDEPGAPTLEALDLDPVECARGFLPKRGGSSQKRAVELVDHGAGSRVVE
jgi:putative transposase